MIYTSSSQDAKRRTPIFNDPKFSKLSRYNWPTGYAESYDDSKSVLRFLHSFNSKAFFFEQFAISETLMNHTSTWTFEEFVGSFLYNYIQSELERKNYILSSYNWKKVLEFTLIPNCSTMVFSILKSNNFVQFSKKEDILEGATLALSMSRHFLDLSPPSPFITCLESLLHFVQISKSSIKPLVASVYEETNATKVILFLENYNWVERQSLALKTGTEYLKKLSLKKETFNSLFNCFVTDKQDELESFDIFNAFYSYEDNVTKISTFTLADSYFLLYSDLLENPESSLLEIFSFFEIKITESRNLFKKENTALGPKRDKKESLLSDLELWDYVNREDKYEDEYVIQIKKYVDEFLQELSFYFDSDENELQVLLENSLIKDVRDISRKTAVSFVLVAGCTALVIGLSQNTRMLQNSSSSPFASMSQQIMATSKKSPPISYPSTTQATVSRRVLTNTAPTSSKVILPNRQAIGFSKIAKQNAKELALYQRSLQAQPTITIKKLGTGLSESSLAKNLIVSPNERIYSDSQTLVQRVNEFSEKVRQNNRVLTPNLTFGRDIYGNFTGEVFILDSVGMQDATQDLRKAIPTIIKEEGLDLYYVNAHQEGDHYKSRPQREAYKLIAKVDTAVSVMKHPSAHQTTTNWSDVTYSRLDQNDNLIPELSYEGGVTPNTLLDHEAASKEAATKAFLRGSYDSNTQKLIMTDSDGTTPINSGTPTISGEDLLELYGSSGAEALKAEEDGLYLTRKQIDYKMSSNGQNTGQEQQLLADCRFFRAGQIATCKEFLGLQGNQETVESCFIQVAENTIAARNFLKTAQVHCKNGGPSHAEISSLLTSLEITYKTTVTEATFNVENFNVSEKEASFYFNQRIPDDLSKEALDTQGIEMDVFKQDKNKTNAFFNNRRELKTINSFIGEDSSFNTYLKLD